METLIAALLDAPRPPIDKRRRIALAGQCAAVVAALSWFGGSVAQPLPPESDYLYKVVPGDTLYDLAGAYLLPGRGWRRLQALNQVEDPKRLEPGRELRMPMAWLRTEATFARVAFVMGHASRERAGDVAPVSIGDELQIGDVLFTDANASVTLRLADSSRLLVAGNTRARIESLLLLGRDRVASSLIGLDGGEVESQIERSSAGPSHYQIRTPVLILGVRGTNFRARFDASASRAAAEVTQGRVATRAQRPGPVLRAGFGLLANAAHGVGKPQRLLPPPPVAGLRRHYDRLPLVISWPPLDGAAGYRVQVYPAAGVTEAAEGAQADQRLLDTLTPQPHVQWADLADGRYRLVVRGRDVQDLEGMSAVLDFVLKARPEAPFLSGPRSGERVFGDSVELNWTRAAAAARYRLQMARDEAFSEIELDRSDVSAGPLLLPLPYGQYYWRLASIDASGDQGPFGGPGRFELMPPPTAPELRTPKRDEGKVTLSWGTSSPQDRFDVQVASDAAFTQPAFEGRVDGAEVTLEKLAPGDYFVRVRTIEPGGFAGAWGSPQQFNVPGSPWWWIPGLLVVLPFLL